MGAITIKIPQNTQATFEITDAEFAERIMRDLKKKSSGTARKTAKKKDLSELSRWLDNYLTNPDPDTVDAINTAEEWRKRWER